MNDYISRKDALDSVCADCSAKMRELCAQEDGPCKKYKAVKATPPADVRPVVHGHWERRVHLSPIVEAFCSICGDPALRAYGHPARTNYCPNCGADMREGGSEE